MTSDKTARLYRALCAAIRALPPAGADIGDAQAATLRAMTATARIRGRLLMERAKLKGLVGLSKRSLRRGESDLITTDPDVQRARNKADRDAIIEEHLGDRRDTLAALEAEFAAVDSLLEFSDDVMAVAQTTKEVTRQQVDVALATRGQ